MISEPHLAGAAGVYSGIQGPASVTDQKVADLRMP